MADSNSETRVSQVRRPANSNRLWFLEWLLNWTLSSPQRLRLAEKFLLSHLRLPYQAFYVDIGSVVGQADQIWTVSLQAKQPPRIPPTPSHYPPASKDCQDTSSAQRTPIVALHGLGSGLCLWLLNLEALAQERSVYAIDLLGFGRSSRPLFSTDAHTCERQLVEALEEWRYELKLQRFILLGHSMGAFIASSYALTYPERVQHLILVDAWGYAVRPSEQLDAQLPAWVRLVGRISLWCNPYWILRAAGPFGTWLVHATTTELLHNFEPLLGDQIAQLTQYIHQCNAASPSGEAAFHTLSDRFAYAKHPMLLRIAELSPNVGMTFIYGANSWVEAKTGGKVKNMRQNTGLVSVIVIEDAGHHVHAEQAQLFNGHVLAACELADKK